MRAFDVEYLSPADGFRFVSTAPAAIAMTMAAIPPISTDFMKITISCLRHVGAEPD